MSGICGPHLRLFGIQVEVWPTLHSILKSHRSTSEVMSDSITPGRSMGAEDGMLAWQHLAYSTHNLVQYTAAALHFPLVLIKDLDVSFVLLKHETSANQIWGILTLFAEEVQLELGFFFWIPVPEITRKCLSWTQTLWFKLKLEMNWSEVKMMALHLGWKGLF